MIDARHVVARLLRAIPRKSINRAAGRFSEANLHPALLRTFVELYSRVYSVDLNETDRETSDFTSVDAFFTRRLRAGARPMCVDRDAVVCPADGQLDAIGRVSEGGGITVKGAVYSIAELVGDTSEAPRYSGGSFAVIYLSPGDYHRVHAPAAGSISLIRSLRGDFFPVNAVGKGYIPSLLVKNRRVAIVLDTAPFGRVTVVMVGALIVGRITVSTLSARDVPFGVHRIEPAHRTERGDEIGVFHLGSTVVVLVEKGVSASRGATSTLRAGGRVRVGESLVWGGR